MKLDPLQSSVEPNESHITPNDPLVCPKDPGWNPEPILPFGRGPTTRLRGLAITMVMNHLQVLGWSSK